MIPYARHIKPNIVECPTCRERITLVERKDFESFSGREYQEHYAQRHAAVSTTSARAIAHAPPATGPAIRLVEIRNLRVNQRLSEETLCFSATIYVDGKKVGEAMNRGHGGNTDVLVPPALIDSLKTYARAYFDQHGDDDDRSFLTPSEPGGYAAEPLEYLIDHLVEREERQKEQRRIAKVEDKQRAAFAERGLPFMLRVSLNDAITWYGLPNDKPDTIAACLGKAKAKYRVITGHEVLSTTKAAS